MNINESECTVLPGNHRQVYNLYKLLKRNLGQYL
jgi:hypothetical protein